MKAQRASLHRFRKLNNQEDCLATNGFVMEAKEGSLGTEEKLIVYISSDHLRRMEEMIIQTMQKHKAYLKASSLHMLMVECAKDIEEFAWVLSDGVAIRSAS